MQTEHNDFEHSHGKNLRFLIIFIGSEECVICFSYGTHHRVFYSDAHKTKLVKEINMEEMNLPRVSPFFTQGTYCTLAVDESGTTA